MERRQGWEVEQVLGEAVPRAHRWHLDSLVITSHKALPATITSPGSEASQPELLGVTEEAWLQG